ncbi:hypothetical protein F5884DRAFT_750338 [Xylogone sp. PMI_703]|nr:hypothetical protein F5884DRAFT_750338 [Xylogone sp. PMI_703]
MALTTEIGNLTIHPSNAWAVLNGECYRDKKTGNLVFGMGLSAPEVYFTTWSSQPRANTPPASESEWDWDSLKDEDCMDEEEEEKEEEPFGYAVPSPTRPGWVIDELSGRDRKRLMMDDLPPAKRQRWIESRLDLQQQQQQEEEEEEEETDSNKTVHWGVASGLEGEEKEEGAAQFRARVDAWEGREGLFLRGKWKEEDEEDEEEW